MTKGTLIEEELSRSVIGAFFDVYNTLGFGFLEHVYVLALEIGLLLHFGPDAKFHRLVSTNPKALSAGSGQSAASG